MALLVVRFHFELEFVLVLHIVALVPVLHIVAEFELLLPLGAEYLVALGFHIEPEFALALALLVGLVSVLVLILAVH